MLWICVRARPKARARGGGRSCRVRRSWLLAGRVRWPRLCAADSERPAVLLLAGCVLALSGRHRRLRGSARARPRKRARTCLRGPALRRGADAYGLTRCIMRGLSRSVVRVHRRGRRKGASVSNARAAQRRLSVRSVLLRYAVLAAGSVALAFVFGVMTDLHGWMASEQAACTIQAANGIAAAFMAVVFALHRRPFRVDAALTVALPLFALALLSGPAEAGYASFSRLAIMVGYLLFFDNLVGARQTRCSAVSHLLDTCARLDGGNAARLLADRVLGCRRGNWVGVFLTSEALLPSRSGCFGCLRLSRSPHIGWPAAGPLSAILRCWKRRRALTEGKTEVLLATMKVVRATRKALRWASSARTKVRYGMRRGGRRASFSRRRRRSS